MNILKIQSLSYVSQPAVIPDYIFWPIPAIVEVDSADLSGIKPDLQRRFLMAGLSGFYQFLFGLRLSQPDFVNKPFFPKKGEKRS